MKNARKTIGWILILTFLLAMMANAVVIPAENAKYSDFAELSDAGKTAVNVLSNLPAEGTDRIIAGYLDGTFKANDKVTRAEFAKMISVAKEGRDITSAYKVHRLTQFTDLIPEAWYSQYINYAYLNGILAGYGNGKMMPTARVTGLEAAKMTLVALGYDPKAERDSLEGIDWKKNTIRLANAAGLFDDLNNAVYEEAFSRENTAIMIYNALKANVVSYEGGGLVKGDTLANVVFGGIGKTYTSMSVAKDAGDDVNALIYVDGVEVDEKPEGCYFEKAEDADGDGDIDAWYFIAYNGEYTNGYEGYFEVTAVDAGRLTLAGFGTVVVRDTTGIVIGDWIKLLKSVDAQIPGVARVEVKSGTIVKYTDNSSHEISGGDSEDDPNTGIGTTQSGGTYTVRFMDDSTKDFTFEDLGLSKDEISYWEGIIGVGSAAVQNGVKLSYIIDDGEIAAIFKNEDTYWEGYAILIDAVADARPGMTAVRLYTDDNEYKDFYVASFNGNSTYDTLRIADIESQLKGYCDKLVKYEVIDDQTVYLYSADYANATSNYVSNQYLYFDITSGKWMGYETSSAGAILNRIPYEWDNATVFVSYEKGMNESWTGNADAPIIQTKSSNDYQWRAYRVDEFQPAYNEAAFGADTEQKTGCDELVYAKGKGVSTLKAAAIRFNYSERKYVLPGLPLRSGEKLGTVMSLVSVTRNVNDNGTPKYAYEAKILLPYNEFYYVNGKLITEETVTLYNPGMLSTFTVGDVYKFFMDEDGIARRFEVAATAASSGQSDSHPEYVLEVNGKAPLTNFSVGSDYLELYNWNASAIYGSRTNGIYELYIEYPCIHNYEDGSKVFAAEDMMLLLTPDTKVFFTNGLFSTDIKAVVPTDAARTDLSRLDVEAYNIYADINPVSKEVYAIWFESNAGDDDKTVTIGGFNIELTYDPDSETATYKIVDTGLTFADGTDTLEVENVKPYQLKMPIGSNKVDVKVTRNVYGNWYVENENAFSGYEWTLYDATTEGKFTFGDNFAVLVTAEDDFELYTTGTGATVDKLIKAYDINDKTQVVFFRENNWHTNLIFGATEDFMYNDFATMVNEVNAALVEESDNGMPMYDYDDDDDIATSYEKVWIMIDSDADNTATSVDSAEMIVLVDTDIVDAVDYGIFPFTKPNVLHY